MNIESMPTESGIKTKKRAKRVLAELTLYEDKTEEVHIFAEAKMIRNGDSVEIRAENKLVDKGSDSDLFSITAKGEESVSLLVDRLMPIYLVNDNSKTYDTAIAPGCTLPPLFSTCKRIKNTISDKGGELDVLYDVNLAFMDVYPKRIHLTVREDNRK